MKQERTYSETVKDKKFLKSVKQTHNLNNRIVTIL